MLSKLPKISKELLITGLVIFAALTLKATFSFTQIAVFVPMNILYMLIAFVPFVIFISSNLSSNFTKELKLIDITAIIVIMYMLFVILHSTVIRYYLLTSIGIVSLSMLLCRNIYTLPVVAVLNLAACFKFGYAAAMSVPVSICFSMVYFSYLFEKASKKKSKKKAESIKTVPDFKKEKIIFAVSEVILFVALAVMIYYRKNTIALITFMSNIEYIIPILVPAICFIILAVIAIKNKKPLTNMIGYAVAVFTMPITQLCEYSIAACGVLVAFMLLLALLDINLDSGKYGDSLFQKIFAEFKKVSKSDDK